MPEEKKKIPKLAKIKSAFYTSIRLLKLTWSISPPLFIGTVISFLLPSIIPFINIYIYKLIIDFVVQAVIKHQTDIQPILFLLALRLVTFYAQEFSLKLQSYFEHVLWLRVPMTFSELVLGKLSHLDIRYFEDNHFRELLHNVDEAYRYRTLNMLSFLMYTLQSALQLFIACVAIASVHWILIIVVIAGASVEFIYQLTKVEIDWGIWWGNSPDRVKFNYLSSLLQDASSLK